MARDTPHWKFETKSVHAGYSPDPTDLKVPGSIYTRIMNPMQDILEQRVATLEGGIAALALASDQAAVTYGIQTIAEAGDTIISSTALYGGTYSLLAHRALVGGYRAHRRPAGRSGPGIGRGVKNL